MTRLAGATATAAAQREVFALDMVRLDFGDGVTAAHTGIGSIDYNGDTYVGVGEYGGVEGITESLTFRPQPINFVLSGVSSDNIGDLSPSNYEGRDVDLYVTLIDEAGSIVGTPVPVWSGFMDVCTLSVSDGLATITVAAESRLAAFDRPRVSRYTDADQQARYAGDVAFEYVPQLVDQQILWGGQKLATPFAGGRVPGGPRDDGRITKPR